MEIRRATQNDIKGIDNLLIQVHNTHAKTRPDLFQTNSKKYTDEDLLKIINNENTPIFVYTENNEILGHAFCDIEICNPPLWKEHKTLYIDDICVDEKHRGKGIAHALFNYVKTWAKENNFYNITLNVWRNNDNAYALYKNLGFTPYKTAMELIL